MRLAKRLRATRLKSSKSPKPVSITASRCSRSLARKHRALPASMRVLPPRLLLVVVVLVPVVPLQGLLPDHGGHAHRGVDRGEHGDLARDGGGGAIAGVELRTRAVKAGGGGQRKGEVLRKSFKSTTTPHRRLAHTSSGATHISIHSRGRKHGPTRPSSIHVGFEVEPLWRRSGAALAAGARWVRSRLTAPRTWAGSPASRTRRARLGGS